MATSKKKAAVSLDRELYDELSLLVWARKKRGDSEANVSAILNELGRAYAANYRAEIEALKKLDAEVRKRQNDLFAELEDFNN